MTQAHRRARFRQAQDSLNRLLAERGKAGGPLPSMLEERIESKAREVEELGRGLQDDLFQPNREAAP